MRFSTRLPLIAIALATALLTPFVPGCGGSSDEVPAIASFIANPGSVQAGGTARLTAQFSGGSGRIDPGVGAVTSGVPVDVTVADDTLYTLSVTGQGETARATAEVNVIYDVSWEFADSGGWMLQGAAPEGGALTLRAFIGAEPGPQVPPSQGCAGARASTTFGDAKLAAGRYGRLDAELRWVTASGLHPIRTVTLRHRGRQWVLDLAGGLGDGIMPKTFLVQWAQAGNARLFIDGVFARDLPVGPTSDADGIELSMRLCPRPFPEPGGSAEWRTDSIAVSAR